ncbi:hypothetical protein C8T65DRAFT_559833, partial [Cerioporus squamosus]
PQEICNLVLDSIANDAEEDYMLTLKTLRTCASVSRAWRIHVQPYLYRDVVITSVADLHKLCATLDTYPRIARAVERLLICVRYEPDARRGLHLDSPQSAIGLFPSLILGRLPKLSGLRVEVLDFGDSGARLASGPAGGKGKEILHIPPRFCSHLSSFMSAVTSLHLENMHLPCFSDYIRMLWALPNITVLHCANL